MRRESLVMTVRDEESEPTVVEVDDDTGSATLHLDDGELLVFDLVELRAAIGMPQAA